MWYCFECQFFCRVMLLFWMTVFCHVIMYYAECHFNAMLLWMSVFVMWCYYFECQFLCDPIMFTVNFVMWFYCVECQFFICDDIMLNVTFCYFECHFHVNDLLFQYYLVVMYRISTYCLVFIYWHYVYVNISN